MSHKTYISNFSRFFMGKKLLKILAPVIFSAGILLGGCGTPLKDIAKYEHLDKHHKKFRDDLHAKYGSEISYNEVVDYLKKSTSLSGWDYDIVKGGLKKGVKNKVALNEKELYGLYEGIDTFKGFKKKEW